MPMDASQESKKKDEPMYSESSDSNESLYSQESVYRQNVGENLDGHMSEMNAATLRRYETFRRSNFPKSAIKKFINNVIGQAVNPNIVIGICGVCKVFVGEMVVEAKKVQKEEGHTGALLPSHIHEAYRRLYKSMPNLQMFKKEPWNN